MQHVRGRERRQLSPAGPEGIRIIATIELRGVCRTVPRLHESPSDLVDPVDYNGDVRLVGAAIGMGEAVLDRVNGLAHVHVIGGQRRLDLSPDRQVDRQRRQVRGVRHPRGVEPGERVLDLAPDEGATVRDGLGGARGLVLGHRPQAVLLLRVGVAVNGRELR